MKKPEDAESLRLELICNEIKLQVNARNDFKSRIINVVVEKRKHCHRVFFGLAPGYAVYDLYEYKGRHCELKTLYENFCHDVGSYEAITQIYRLLWLKVYDVKVGAQYFEEDND